MVEPEGESAADEASGPVADAPLLVDAADGIALTGPPPLVAALARSLALQLCASLSPARYRVRAPVGAVWASALPHEQSVSPDGVWEWDGEGRIIRIDPNGGDVSAGVLLHLGGRAGLDRAAATSGRATSRRPRPGIPVRGRCRVVGRVAPPDRGRGLGRSRDAPSCLRP